MIFNEQSESLESLASRAPEIFNIYGQNKSNRLIPILAR